MILTKFYARFFGLWEVLAVLAMVANRDGTIAALNALFANPGMIFITGIFTLFLGLAVVVSHNRWSGGVVAVIVTLYGWIAIVKGLLFLWPSLPLQATLYQAMQFPQHYYEYLGVPLVVGAYLVYAGFQPSAARE